jgi:hypothetical protein
MITIIIQIQGSPYKVRQTPGLNYMSSFEYKWFMMVFSMTNRYTAMSV